MRMPKLEFQKYIASKYEECLELFELNYPAYFAEEEREDYRKFLKHDSDLYLLGIAVEAPIATHFFLILILLPVHI